MRNIVLLMVLLVGIVTGRYDSWNEFNYVDPYFDSSLSCYNCIQYGYVYCRYGTQEQVMLRGNSTPPPEVCCKNYLDCPPLYKKNWTCSTNFEDKMLALRMCPQK